jgi:predicted dienelactone hydrolase
MKLVLFAIALLATGAAADAAAASPSRVGHTVEHIAVEGSAPGPDLRKIDVHVWYPAARRGFAARPKTIYKSTLHDRYRELPAPWTPLSWTVAAEIARDDAPPARDRGRLPVIVFSHGSVNDPIDYAHTLERIAGAGFVVAAPYHTNNTQDDVRIDFVNTQAGFPVFPCNDGRPSSCSRPQVAFSMADRVADISAVLDALPKRLGPAVDVARVGVMGHSRGTVTALAAAGGSAPWMDQSNCVPSGGLCWPLKAEPRVKAIMGMAIGATAVTAGAGVTSIKVPTLLVAGALDRTSPQTVSRSAFDDIASTEKAFVSIPKAVHRSFDSTYCAQAQAAGAIADRDPNAILDDHTYDGIVFRVGASGRATEYCSYETFTQPADIRERVKADTGFDVTAESVPSTGLDADEVKPAMAALATAFFGKALRRHPRVKLASLIERLDIVGCAEVVTRRETTIFPPGLGSTCGT